MKVIPPSPPLRRRLDGSEEVLVQSLLGSGMPIDSRATGRQVTFREPGLPTGFPDIVVAHLAGEESEIWRGASITLRDLKILAHAYSSRERLPQTVASSLGLSVFEVNQTLENLIHSGVVPFEKEKFHLPPMRDIFCINKITAIEVKVSSWRRAIQQAIGNTWFASHSYVALPSTKISQQVIDHASESGIGIMAIGANGGEVFLRARSQGVPNNYGTWLFNYWAHIQNTHD